MRAGPCEVFWLRPSAFWSPIRKKTLAALSRHRRSKIARAAHTTLVKADQWARGELAPGELSSALESALGAASSKKKK